MKKINCLIVDDEALARKLLQNYIEQMPYLALVGICKNPMEAMGVLQTTTVDLMFLDIQMPQITGISFLKSLQNKPYVIFTTAYEKYALEGYTLDVVDYLLKPFSFERFFQSINKVSERLQMPLQEPNFAAAPIAESVAKDFILVKSEHRIHRLKFKDILYIQAMQSYVAFYLVEGRILSLNTMKQLEIELPINQFIRIHKSYIVAIDKIALLENNQILVDKVKLPIGASYREVVMKMLF